MRVLLDTHLFIWYVNDDSQHLTKNMVKSIERASEVFVSSASIWEIAIKVQLKKLDLNVDSFVKAISESGFYQLPVTVQHAASTVVLPKIHRDPFDRILVA